MNKKVLYIGISALAIIIIMGSGYFIFGKTKNKSLLLIVDKIYSAYGDFIHDVGYSPNSIKDLYSSNGNDARWKGPYISDKIVSEYKEGNIDIIKASLIPTKTCSLDSIINCYTWIVVDNANDSSFAQAKEEVKNSANIFYANNKLYFKITQAE